MSEEKQETYKREDLYDPKEEQKLFNNFINIALNGVDNSWTSVPKHKDCPIHHTKVKNPANGNESIMVRSEYILKTKNTNTKNYFNFEEIGYDIPWSNWRKNNDLIGEKLVACIDKNHGIALSQWKSPSYVIWPRDFLYFRTRKFIDKYESKDKKVYKNIAATMNWSMYDKKHPFYVKEDTKNFVRGFVVFHGEMCLELNENEIKIIMVKCVDPAGSIPQWIINTQIENNGLTVKEFGKYWDKMCELLKERETKQLKPEHKPLLNDVKEVEIITSDKNDDNIDDNNTGKDEEKEKEN